ncbi:MAPEG family protein [Acinetobacter sp. ABJ_C4_1]|uniref:MAPEG family protein n=1 Tax=Acinetobacter sp. ABJ_C4_1 TaxID=3377080 RepID=UPI0037CAB9D5
MNIPTWILLAFAGWTLLILFSTVGVYRWSRILTGRATISEWQAGQPQGSDWYQRAMAAHRNCIENLPVFAAIVIAINHFELYRPVLDSLAIGVLVARIAQSLIHICLVQSDRVATWRFIFFFTQIIAMIWMGIYIVLKIA